MKPDQRRDDYAAWLTSLGVDINTVPLDAEFRISRPDDAPPTLTVEVFRTDADGKRIRSGDNLMRDWLTVPLAIEPPGGHLPNQPSREQLLAALERVRKLADQWAMLRMHGGDAYELRAALDIPGARP